MEKDCIRRGRIEVSLWGHCCSLYWHRITPRDSFPGPTVSPVRKESKMSPQLWIHFLGGSLGSCIMGNHFGNLWGLITGDQKEVEKKCSQILEDHIPVCISAHVALPAHLQNLANGLYWQWSLFRGCTQAGKQIYSPSQLLIIASSSVRTKGLTRERRQPWSPSYCQESSQQPFSPVEHSLWFHSTREPKQWPWAAWAQLWPYKIACGLLKTGNPAGESTQSWSIICGSTQPGSPESDRPTMNNL